MPDSNQFHQQPVRGSSWTWGEINGQLCALICSTLCWHNSAPNSTFKYLKLRLKTKPSRKSHGYVHYSRHLSCRSHTWCKQPDLNTWTTGESSLSFIQSFVWLKTLIAWCGAWTHKQAAQGRNTATRKVYWWPLFYCSNHLHVFVSHLWVFLYKSTAAGVGSLLSTMTTMNTHTHTQFSAMARPWCWSGMLILV